MSGRNKVLDYLSNMEEVERVQIKAEEPLPNGGYIMQLYIYLAPQGSTPPPLGVHVAEEINTQDTMR